MLSSLYKCFPNLNVVAQMTLQEAKDERKSAYAVLKFLFQKPTEENENLIRKIRLRNKAWLSPYEGSTGKRLYGKIVNLHGLGNDFFKGGFEFEPKFLATDAEVFIVKYDDKEVDKFQLMLINGKAAMGGPNHYRQGEPSEMKLKLIEGSEFRGHGKLHRLDGSMRMNKVVIFNEVHYGRVSTFSNVTTSEFMYANGYQLSMKPQSDAKCNFYFVKQPNGFYHIKSITNLKCLEGGHEGCPTPANVYMSHIGNIELDYYNWKWSIIKKTANENEFYIQSKSSGLYMYADLHGKLWLDHKNDHDNKFLWKINHYDVLGNSFQVPESELKVGEEWSHKSKLDIEVLGWRGWYDRAGNPSWQKVPRDDRWHEFLVEPANNGKIQNRNKKHTWKTKGKFGHNGFNAVEIKHKPGGRRYCIQCFKVPLKSLQPVVRFSKFGKINDYDVSGYSFQVPESEQKVGEEWTEGSSRDIEVYGWKDWNGKVGNQGFQKVPKDNQWHKFEVNPFNNGYIHIRNKDGNQKIRGLFHHNNFNAVKIKHMTSESRYVIQCYELTWN